LIDGRLESEHDKSLESPKLLEILKLSDTPRNDESVGKPDGKHMFDITARADRSNDLEKSRSVD
jgi:hypothetical protein